MPNQAPKTAVGARAGAQGQQADAPAASPWKSVLQSIAMFFVIQAVTKYGLGYLGMGSKSEQTPAPSGPASPGSTLTPANTTPGKALAYPIWPLGTPISMVLYLSTSETADDVNLANPLLTWDGLTFGNWKDEREEDLILDVPESVRNHNGSWWMDVKLVKDGGSPEHRALEDVATYRKQLVRYIPKRRARKEKKLIGGDEIEEDEVEDLIEQPKQQIVGHWSRNLTLTIISDVGSVDTEAINPAMMPHYLIVPGPTESSLVYYPPVFPNDFWLLRENLWAINETSTQLPLRVNYQALSSMKFGIFSTMTVSMEQTASQQGSGAEMDEVKRMLTETSPWLLITTAIVTLLHTVFEFLAFSSDVSHWRKKDKDLVGVSLNTILTNCFVQLVILLYLHDSSEETSFMILFGQGIGLLIEAWKITKVVDVRVRENPNSFIGYSVVFENKRELSEDEKRTQEYDQLAFRLVSYGAIPLLAGYTVYSLLYETHRGWYSFIVTTLAQAIYMFGFVQLVPQLIINYKLKSVAHMPMKAMMYKTLSTVVDDFFAFCIRMPWLHRLACFRDDVVFCILIYQRWIYRVDYSRVNEYGQVNEGMVEPVGDKAIAGKDASAEKETKKTK